MNGGNGVVDIGGGGVVWMIVPDARVNVGAAFADEGRPVGGAGQLSVVGDSDAQGHDPSVLRVTGDVVVGAPESMGGGEASGLLSVAEGGHLQADRVLVGSGGRLDGRGERLRADGSFSVDYGSDATNIDGGLIVGDVVLDGGALAPGGALGLFSIDGDFTSLGGFLDIDIDIDVAGTGVGWSDLIRVSGDFLGAGAFGVRMNFIDGFLPQVGDSFSFLEVAGDATRLETLFAASLITVENAGLPRGSQVSLAHPSGRLSAVVGAVGVVLPPDPTDPDAPPQPPVTPAPLPGALGLLLGGLAMIAAVSGRGRGAARRVCARRAGI